MNLEEHKRPLIAFGGDFTLEFPVRELVPRGQQIGEEKRWERSPRGRGHGEEPT